MAATSYTAIVEKEGDGYVSLCPELDVASQGTTVEEATANLKEAVQLFLECADPQEVQRREITGLPLSDKPWLDRKSTRLNSSHSRASRMPSSA